MSDMAHAAHLLGTGTAKETLDKHIGHMVNKRTASKFFLDEEEDEQQTKELEQALLHAHE